MSREQTRDGALPALALTPLADRPDLVPDCARWLYDEWGGGKMSAFRGTLEWLRGVADGAGGEEGTLAFLDGRAVGVALLVACDLERRADLTPWLSSLYVVPDQRGRGIGGRLIDAIAAAARARGHARLYLYTEIEAYYRARGWALDERFRRDGEDFTVMSLGLYNVE